MYMAFVELVLVTLASARKEDTMSFPSSKRKV